MIDAFNDADVSLLLGASIRDTPLVRALSRTRHVPGERIGVLLRADFSQVDDEAESLALNLARRRASELNYVPLFPDFPCQVSQLVLEAILRMVNSATDPKTAQSFSYGDRLETWWQRWEALKSDDAVTAELVRALSDAYQLCQIDEPSDSGQEVSERLQLELWVREDPKRGWRDLLRWARATDRNVAGVNGKRAELRLGSTLAPVHAFAAGRPVLLDVRSLESQRHDLDQYTWKTFLCVPLRAANVIVGVMCLASSCNIDQTSMARDETTRRLVEYLKVTGGNLVSTTEQLP